MAFTRCAKESVSSERSRKSSLVLDCQVATILWNSGRQVRERVINQSDQRLAIPNS